MSATPARHVAMREAAFVQLHSVPGVNAGYITRSKLLGDHLRHQQETISRKLTEAARAKFKDGKSKSTKWFFLPARRVLKEMLRSTNNATNISDAKLHLGVNRSDADA